MRRRALLGTALTVAVAGCGWSQEQEGGGPSGQPEQDSGGGSSEDTSPEENGGGGGDGDRNGEDDGDGDGDENLAASEGGADPIEEEAEALLLRLEDLEGDGWEETDVQVTGTCNTFRREEEERTFTLQSCAAVYEDEAAAVEAYEEDLDRSLKLMSEEIDIDPNVGDEAAVVREGPDDGQLGETRFRLLFRDSNAVGRVDYRDQQGLAAAEREEFEPIDPAAVVEFGVAMHGRWRN